MDKFQLLLSRLIQDKQVLSLTELFFNDKKTQAKWQQFGHFYSMRHWQQFKNNLNLLLTKAFWWNSERACLILIRFNVMQLFYLHHGTSYVCSLQFWLAYNYDFLCKHQLYNNFILVVALFQTSFLSKTSTDWIY